MSTGYSTVKLPDGAILAYEIYGSFHLGTRVPIVLICGMSSLRIDYERLTRSLSQTRPVLIYDHRGMGNSRLADNEDISIEMLARDLAFLLHALRWREISICGYSMGGVIAQQLLVLPYHPTRPMQLGFRTTHLFLVATRSVVQKGVGIDYKPPPTGTIRTLEERKAGARRIIESTFDPEWIAENGARLDAICEKVFTGISNRPGEVIGRRQVCFVRRSSDIPASYESEARNCSSYFAMTYVRHPADKGPLFNVQLQNFDFADLLSKLPTDMKVLVIHGNIDRVIPRYCGEDVHTRIRGAVFLESGTRPGQVPSLDFGHYWYEYFDIEVWQDVVDSFIDNAAPPSIY